jgi:hypothetical protein
MTARDVKLPQGSTASSLHDWRPLTLLLAFVVSLLGCGLPTSPDAPKDPGTVTVVVHDNVGMPVANVHVEITEPNNVGSFFRVGADTDAAGMRTFQGVPAGQRPVEITPPSGYVAGTDGLIQNANVIKNKTTTVSFTLIHQ